MRLFKVLAFSPLFIAPVFAQELLPRLRELGLGGFAQLLALDNPPFLADLCNRNDVTIWAPGNDSVAALLATRVKRDQGSDTARQGSAPTPTPNNPAPGLDKRQHRPRPPVYPDTLFEVILTFLNDSNGMNLGNDQRTPFTKNFASPLDGSSTSASIIEVVSGLGDTQNTLRGPFSFANGVIYEVSDFFTVPESFTATMEHINLAQRFYNTVVTSGRLSFFEETTAITVFVPIDTNCPNAVNPDDYILDPPFLGYSPGLRPGRSYTTVSGETLHVTWGSGGVRLVNGRSIVKANIPIKNGVMHFIDGPLF